jgi:hypothetical protein
MSMLRSCSYPDCEILTLSSYCLEHEQQFVVPHGQAVVRDEPMAREVAEVVVRPAPLRSS